MSQLIERYFLNLGLSELVLAIDFVMVPQAFPQQAGLSR